MPWFIGGALEGLDGSIVRIPVGHDELDRAWVILGGDIGYEVLDMLCFIQHRHDNRDRAGVVFGQGSLRARDECIPVRLLGGIRLVRDM